MILMDGKITQFPQPARSDRVVEVQLYAERLTLQMSKKSFWNKILNRKVNGRKNDLKW